MTYSVSTDDFSDLDQCNSSSNTLSEDTLHQNPPNIEVSNSHSSSSNQPNIKVIPISFNNPNQPTVESTTSSIEDILADKVERIAAHLEKANSNILHVDNRIRSFRTEHSKNLETANQQESIQTLTELRDQIDARLKEQAQVNQNLNKSIKSLKNVSEKASTFPANKNNVNPLFNSNHTYPGKSIQFSEDTQTFLERIRREADQRVNDALRTVENSENMNSNNEMILQKLESILHQQEMEKDQKNLNSRLAENKILFESESQKFKRTAKIFEEEKKKLQMELKTARSEITGLKIELDQLKHEVHLNNMHKMKKLDQDQSNQRDNESQIHALKATLQSLISSRAELENELESYKKKVEQKKIESENTLAQLRIKYENEISEYQREYDRQLRNLQNDQYNKSHTTNKENHTLRKENDQLRKKVSYLSHEIEQRDIQIADVRSSFNLLQNRNQSVSQEDRGFLVSVASILNDLTGKKGTFIDTKSSTEKLKRDIVDELASGVERISLAEKMQLKAEFDRKEMKERVKVLLDRIDREKQLQIEAHSMQNERAFQDTIQVLQNELERTRKQIKIQNKNYSR